nr:MAG TPA: hypothetical protein [Caudoviricetes sp.]
MVQNYSELNLTRYYKHIAYSTLLNIFITVVNMVLST